MPCSRRRDHAMRMLRRRLQWRLELLQLIADGRKDLTEAVDELDALGADIVELRAIIEPQGPTP